ncbi:hypothetical protein GFD17_10220 [Bifidobacterium sp. SMB2]|uniref:Secreted protein n=1 Tax=Bifidobacterium saimiriisciurei TaxID=2661627 RepID=A0ABX0CBU4_9BIFI|nr:MULTISPECIES: hypothetical protein [Bifidobacterium]NEG97116.1 hypothetical protein [Bifidobacterium sp. SMB2]NEH12563.1 hypothetical protein [Bifidobacterium saimiriisciurei]
MGIIIAIGIGIIIVAAIILAIWAALHNSDEPATPVDDRLIKEHGRIKSSSSTQDLATGETITTLTFQDNTIVVTRTMSDGTSSTTTSRGALDSDDIRQLAQSVHAEYIPRMGHHTYGPSAHTDTRHTTLDGAYRDSLDQAVQSHNVYVPNDLPKFRFGVNRAIDDYVRVGRSYGTLSAYTYQYSERLESSFGNNHPKSFVFDLYCFGTMTPQWNTDIVALRDAIRNIGEHNVDERDGNGHHIVFVGDDVSDTAIVLLYQAFAACVRE